ncbi:MAG TPA: hypothetical protein VMI06_17345 [Terriglobia bacterium]|nr:hypothetical protein [Terriglobia bacterium]
MKRFAKLPEQFGFAIEYTENMGNLHYYEQADFVEVKRLFADAVRSKNEIAMRNKALAKLLAYNITLLVHAIYELHLEPSFGGEHCPPTILKFPGVG